MGLVWAPDGRRFAVVLEKARIVTMAIDGSDPRFSQIDLFCCLPSGRDERRSSVIPR
jgi:hypothetical protein